MPTTGWGRSRARSTLETITKEQSKLIASQLEEIAHVVSDASSLISWRQYAESLAEIEAAFLAEAPPAA